MRSHPPTLLKISQRTLVEECALKAGDKILVAVSGGMDSMCLLQVLAKLVPGLGGSLAAHGVDHGLRQEAASELDRAEELALSLGVQFARTRIQLTAGGNLQHRAREARYAALMDAASAAGATLIATAHHADDRAETVLMRLLRGSGPQGLAVLPARAGMRIRPFIRASRKDIAAHATRHRIAYAEDPSNRDHRFLRARVRHELLPLLEDLSPQIVKHLNLLADALARELPGVLGGEALNRAQLEQLYRTLRLGRPGVRLPIGDDFEISIQRRKAVAARKMATIEPDFQETDESGGAKPGKRG